jgi:hypothetical protein
MGQSFGLNRCIPTTFADLAVTMVRQARFKPLKL